MKKILATLAGVLLVYIGVCFSLGFVAESSVKEQLEFQKQSPNMNGLKIEMTNYSRGIFGSDMDVTVQFAGGEPLLNNVVLKSHSKLQHGPLLFLNGFSIGAYASQSTLVINTGVEEADKKIKALFGDSIGLISANYGFNKTYSGDWTLDAISSNENNTEFKLDKSVIKFSGDFKNMSAPNMEGDIAIGALSVKDATTEVTTDPWTGKLVQHYIDAGVPLTNMNLGVKKISVKSAMGMQANLENLTIEQKQEEKDQKVNTLVAVRLDKFAGPMEVNNSFYQIEVNNLPAAAIKKFYESMKGVSSPEEQMAALVPALTGLLADGAELKLGLGSEFMGGKVKSDFNLQYHSVNGKHLMEMQTPEEMLALFAANLDVTVSEAIVVQTPMGAQIEPLVGTYVTKENGNYNLKGQLKDTQVVIGTQTIPAEQYMPLLMMGAMGLAASQTPAGEEMPVDPEAEALVEEAGETAEEEIPTEE
jgi:uncharacterized protein YdgA (DUF945 family)